MEYHFEDFQIHYPYGKDLWILNSTFSQLLSCAKLRNTKVLLLRRLIQQYYDIIYLSLTFRNIDWTKYNEKILTIALIL